MTSPVVSPHDQHYSPAVGVCALVPEDWTFPWRSRHHVLSRLSRYFQVVWVDPAPGWREVVKGRARTTPGVAADAPPPNLTRYEAEVWLPKFLRPGWLAEATFGARVRRAKRLLERAGCTTTILYLWRPEFAPAIRAANFDLTCYHIADEYSFSATEVPVDPAEMQLIADVDQVFIHSPGLLDRLGSFNPNTAFVPNGVDYAAFATRAPEPADLAPIPHPRIGYNGWIKRHLNWDLIRSLAGQHRDWQFVFVGPMMHAHLGPILDDLSRLGNVHFLGEKSSRELATYPQHFDVCVMPYTRADYSADFIYPLKLHEYLASGSPVVGTRIRSLEQFSDIVPLPVSADEWSAAITEALGDDANAPSRREARQTVAREHDWDALATRVARLLSERLHAKRLATGMRTPGVRPSQARHDEAQALTWHSR